MIPILARAPTRICDLGGWTDTWFAERGIVCHLPVWPGVEAAIERVEGPPGVDVDARAVGRRWRWHPGTDAATSPDPLIAATIADASPSADASLVLRITSDIPAGASMGTSASTCVAVRAALDRLAGVDRSAADQARRAHAIETGRLGWQSGVQDQWAAATTRAQLLAIDAYPDVTCRPLDLSSDTRQRLDEGLLVVWLGRSHSSNAVHQQVISCLRESGPGDERLEGLRRVAREGAEALERGDVEAYGACLARNTALQQRLHPGLVGVRAAAVISVAQRTGVSGWKVNGAGGEGGTVSLLCTDAGQRAEVAARIVAAVPDTRVLPVRLAGS